MSQAHGLARPAPPRKWGRRVRLFLIWGVLLCGLLIAGGTAYALLTLPPLPSGIFDPSRPSIVYAADGKPVGPLSGDIFRLPVGMKQMPQFLPQAFVASEDVRFYQHGAVDPRGILRALITDVRTGGIREGGSTITQQVVKNTFLTSHQTFKRKVQEIALAVQVERIYTKDEILGIYLNEIYMGNGTYGVGAAAKLYFNKEASALTLGEAATLVGITPAPESYNPLRHLDLAKERRDTVLDRMVVAGYLDAAQATAEKAKPLQLNQGKLELKNPYAWYMDTVRQELKDRYQLDERAVELMGLKVYTGLAPELQRTAEGALAAKIFPNNTPAGIQGAFVAVDPRSGEVRALVGGREYVGGMNRATDAQVLPGSAFKPITVFGPAFEYAGITPDSKVEDKPLDIAGWKPQNFDFQFRGEVTVREAASHSMNIPAINLLQRVGIAKSATFAAQLGIPIAKEDQSLNMALGSLNHGLNPLQMAGAYQAFANGGTYVQPHLITRVEAADGPLPATPVETHRAMSPKTAYLVTDILKTVVKEGTGVGALLSRPMAGKTGTVELPAGPAFQGKQGGTAAWFVGYTPDLVGAIWLGYDQTDKDHFLPPEVNGSTHPTRIWHQVVGAFLDGQPPLPFPGPDGKLAQAAKPPAVAKPPVPTPPPLPDTPLPAIRNLTASPGSAPGTVDVHWDVEAGQSVAFQVARGTSPDVPMVQAVALVPSSSFTDMPPGPGTYYYRVASVDPATRKLGPASAAIRVVLGDTANPGGPGPGVPPTPPGPPGDKPPGEKPPGEKPPVTPPPPDQTPPGTTPPPTPSPPPNDKPPGTTPPPTPPPTTPPSDKPPGTPPPSPPTPPGTPPPSPPTPPGAKPPGASPPSSSSTDSSHP